MERSCFGVSPPDADAAADIGSGEAVRERPFSKLLEVGQAGRGVWFFFPPFDLEGWSKKREMEWACSALLDWRPK